MVRLFSRCAAASIVVNLLFVTDAAVRDRQVADRASDQAAGESEVIEFDGLELPRLVDRKVEKLPIPESIRQLAGRRVQIRVFMQIGPDEAPAPYLAGVPEVKYIPLPATDQPCTELPERKRVSYIVPVLLSEGLTIEWNNGRSHRPLLIEGELMIEGDSMDLEFGACPFRIKNATYKEVERCEGYDRLWGWWAC